MAKLETYTCDICTKQKGEANHWFRIFVEIRRAGPYLGVMIVTWNFTVPIPDDTWQEIAQTCGQTHAMEWVSKNFFGAQK